jgi:4-amino-4-deoxy-L-arabinose transferase-like glycosyltransferase
MSKRYQGHAPNEIYILLLLAGARLALHTLTNHHYGFHRDELATLDDARHLAWGYVAYPPFTPLIGRVALELWGPSLVGVRFFAALAQSVAMVLAGLLARALGGTLRAQVLAALAVAIAPMSLLMGALFQYNAFDYLWWVLLAYLLLRVLQSGDERWWLAVGTVVGMGLMTKYTIAVYLVGIVAGILLTSARRHLRSPWLWSGVALAALLVLPNILWQIQHDFITLDFLQAIRARDVELGRADDFLLMQLIVSANIVSLPLWVAGLYWYIRTPDGARYRALGWMYIVPLLLLVLMQGRFYYLAPAYPMLLAAGAVVWERFLARRPAHRAQLGWGATWGAVAVGALLGGMLMLPIAPVNSAVWKLTSAVHDNFVEQLGWPELVATVAEVYRALPADEQPTTGILTANYGQAGAINLYGPAYGLGRAISGVNSYWLRGYGDPPPQVLIVVGFERERAMQFFSACEVAAQITNRYNVSNEETRANAPILVCRGLRQSWPAFWSNIRSFG